MGNLDGRAFLKVSALAAASAASACFPTFARGDSSAPSSVKALRTTGSRRFEPAEPPAWQTGAMTRVHDLFPAKNPYWTKGGPDYTQPDCATDWAQWFQHLHRASCATGRARLSAQKQEQQGQFLIQDRSCTLTLPPDSITTLIW